MIKFKCFIWFTFSLMMAAHGQDQLSIDVTCAINGELNGRVNIKIRGNYAGHEGSGPYTIEIDGPTKLEEALSNENGGTLSLTGLAPGSYNVFITDRFGCSTPSSFEICEDELDCNIDLRATTVNHDPLVDNCISPSSGLFEGEIKVETNDPNVEFEWTKNGEPFITPFPYWSLQTLEPGVYTITASHKDYPDECSESITVEIFECFVNNKIGDECKQEFGQLADLIVALGDMAASSNFSITNSSSENSMGSINWDLEYDQSIFQIFWTGPNGEIYNEIDPSGLAPGEYCLDFEVSCAYATPHENWAALYLFSKMRLNQNLPDERRHCVTIEDCSVLNEVMLISDGQESVEIGNPSGDILISISKNEGSRCSPSEMSIQIESNSETVSVDDGISISLQGYGGPASGDRENFEIADMQSSFLLPNLEDGNYRLVLSLENGCSKIISGLNFEYNQFACVDSEPYLYSDWPWSIAAGLYENPEPCIDPNLEDWDFIPYTFDPISKENPCLGGTIHTPEGAEVRIGTENIHLVTKTIYNNPNAPNLCGANDISVDCIIDVLELQKYDSRINACSPRISARTCIKRREIYDPGPQAECPLDQEVNNEDYYGSPLTSEEINSLGIPCGDAYYFVNENPVCTKPSECTELIICDGILLAVPRNTNVCLFTFATVTDPSVSVDGYIVNYCEKADNNCGVSITPQAVSLSQEVANLYEFCPKCIEDRFRMALKEETETKLLQKSEKRIVKKSAISYFPNPFSEYITLRFESNEIHTLHILITDLLGRKIYDKELTTVSGINDIKIDQLRNAPDGVYLARIIERISSTDADNTSMTERIVEGGQFKIIKTR